MFDRDRLEEIKRRRKAWEEGTLRRSLERFGAKESPNRFYTPGDIPDFDFLGKVGFPGEFPFTAGNYPTSVPGATGGGYILSGGGLVRAGDYSGYGTPEDTRDFYRLMTAAGRPGGPNLAFDLPTQLGYDSDDPLARGEVGKTGVAVDSLRDMEVIYEAWTGASDLDKIASNFTINAPCNIILAMYIALADKRGIPLNKLRGTPQNDILKEYIARGTYIFPPRPALRMVRDTITYCTQHLPAMNTISITGYHMREAGASGTQVLAFTFSDAIAYIKLGTDAGLDIDTFMPRFTFHSLGGSMDFFAEIALQRAARRMWARIARDRLGAKQPRSWLYRCVTTAMIGNVNTTVQRPLNNLTRSVIGGIASALSGGGVDVRPFYDEALGLGFSAEALQLRYDAARILEHEAKLNQVTDPLAGSYYVESLTDRVEQQAWELLEKVDAMGGAVAAIEKGFVQQEIARSAYEFQREVETGQRTIVGVNKFMGENELEVSTSRLVPHPYDPMKREQAEERQIANLARVRKERDNATVAAALKRLREEARDESVNLIPAILEAVKAYATLGEMCGILREVFGEYREFGVA
ncbi:MAG: methylmalonyl-CoA mutase [Chloroflexi bacterium]|nr:methylmalonyl-CoA mutase [Chloroflexota bacterium]